MSIKVIAGWSVAGAVVGSLVGGLFGFDGELVAEGVEASIEAATEGLQYDNAASWDAMVDAIEEADPAFAEEIEEAIRVPELTNRNIADPDAITLNENQFFIGNDLYRFQETLPLIPKDSTAEEALLELEANHLYNSQTGEKLNPSLNIDRYNKISTRLSALQEPYKVLYQETGSIQQAAGGLGVAEGMGYGAIAGAGIGSWRSIVSAPTAVAHGGRH